MGIIEESTMPVLRTEKKYHEKLIQVCTYRRQRGHFSTWYNKPWVYQAPGGGWGNPGVITDFQATHISSLRANGCFGKWTLTPHCSPSPPQTPPSSWSTSKLFRYFPVWSWQPYHMWLFFWGTYLWLLCTQSRHLLPKAQLPQVCLSNVHALMLLSKLVNTFVQYPESFKILPRAIPTPLLGPMSP